MHVAGLLWTTDFNYALKDLRIKLPLLALPVIFSSGPVLSSKQFRLVLLALIASVLSAAMIGFAIWAGWTGVEVKDIRDISPFVSHIRLSLLICLAVITGLYFVAVEHRYVAVLVPVLVALVAFLVLLESVTGIGILIAVLINIGVRRSFYLESKWWRALIIAACVAIPCLMYLYIKSVNSGFAAKEVVDYASLEKSTASGNEYNHLQDNQERENGYLIWIYLCDDELEQQWNQRSDLDYRGLDRKGQELRHTLIRYMTSLGLRKDSAGVWALSKQDVEAVESGIANVVYTSRFGLYGRVHQLIWEVEQYRKGLNPSGHSLTMRFEYWKTALNIIRQQPLTGVGTGDLPDAFKEQYVKDGSMLDEKWRLRAHNQYLSIAVAFGIPGLLLFISVLFYTLVNRLQKGDTLFLAFWLVAAISMFTEDTLETQAGVTFFALFYCLFLFVNPQKGDRDGISGH
jgi:hypothetical protein